MTATIPARLSVDDHDFADNYDLAQRLIIAVDGIDQQRVLSYDTEAGFIVRHKVDRAGNLVVDREAECIVTEEIHGIVSVTLKPADA